MGPDCDSVMPGRMFDTSQFAGIAMNQPAAAAARGHGKGRASKKPPTPQQEFPQHAAKTNAAASIMILFHQNQYTGHIPSLPPGLPSLAAVHTGGRAPVPCTLFLDESSAKDDDSMHSSKSGILLGDKGLVNSPYFSENNDMMASLPTDNEVSKYSFYSCLSHYMEGHGAIGYSWLDGLLRNPWSGVQTPQVLGYSRLRVV
jgi:hypothetical protein